MRIVRLQAEGFKRIEAVDITPDGDLVALGGDNGEGKSSVLDAIFAALGGAAAAPVKPVRTGEEYAIIKLDLGDVKVTRYFDVDGADRLKVENAEGAVYQKAQTMLDSLVGRIAFDPLSFANLPPAKQAEELRRLVTLSVDPAEVERLNKIDFEKRRDVNRDGKAVKARYEGIVIPEGDLGPKPDRDKIAADLASAADTNSTIEREKLARETERSEINRIELDAERKRDRARQLRADADLLDEEAKRFDEESARRGAALDAAPPIPEPVDTAKLSEDLANANRINEIYRRKEERDGLIAEFNALKTRSEALTKAMDERNASVEKALAEAEFPVKGLSLGRLADPTKPDEPGELIVMYEGEPFSQASTGGQIRVSARLAMAMNPRLRIMIVKEGAFLDGKNLALLREIAAENDFQVWIETVGEREGVGIIMEAGKVRGAPAPEKIEAPRRRKKADEGDGAEKDAAAELSRATSTIPGDMAQTAHPEPSDKVDPPARRKPTAMREFTSKPAGGGDLFGGGGSE